MTLQDAQALTSPFVRCRDGRIGTISRIRAGYALTDASQDAVGVQVRGEPALRWIPIQHSDGEGMACVKVRDEDP